MLLRALSGVSLAALAAPLCAQDSAPPDDIVITAERAVELAIQQVEETPGGADVVAATDYEDKVAVSLRDALAFSPGVYAQPRFGQEVRLSIRGSGISRGFHMRGLTLLQDGVPINLADDNGDFQELDPLVLQHLEVFRGANALRFGASTLGGAINGVTPTGRSASGLTFRLDGGSFATARALAGYGMADARGDAFVALTGDRSDGDRDHAGRASLRLHGNLGIRLTDRIETRFYASAQTIRQDLPGGLTRADIFANPEKGNVTGDQERDIDSIRVQNRTRFDLGGGTLDIGVFLSAKELFHPIFEVVDQVSTDWGAYTRFDVERGPFALSAGATARSGSVRSQRYRNVNGDRGARTFLADQRARTIDLYAEGRYRPAEPLTLIAGAVYTSGLRRQDAVLPASASGRAHYDEVSPKFGLLFEPVAKVQFYANYSRSHELPGYIELAQIATFVDLASQRGWTAEIGARGALGPARFDIGLYRADLQGELLQFSVAPPTIPAATFNAGRTRHQGIEAGLDIDLTSWARLRQAYQLNDFAFRGDAQYGDNRLPVIPRHLYRAELRLGTDAFHVAPNLEWAPQGGWADYANSFRAGGYVLAGLTASAAVSGGLEVFLDARNLGDRRAIGDISAVTAFDPASAVFTPVERRAVFGGVRLRLP
ncbi:TonB-dependent receptor [Sphingomonas gilva]|uniref:TonB-dependent receptor n=2 Tax=Sphingomonas gilva TaxID=2305907 RepID=A0A396S0L3_9SPHN|nr:TonB-dependent receptor [Sphingomonas gilva]RHW16895.1 TonB-dependent receptor [Sphingomonas gilva]